MNRLKRIAVKASASLMSIVIAAGAAAGTVALCGSISAAAVQSSTAASTELINCSSVSDEIIALGSTVTVYGAAEGGAGDYQYGYRLSSFCETEIIGLDGNPIQPSFSKSTTHSYTPTSTGRYTIKVTVKDADGKTAAKSLHITVVDALRPLQNNATVSKTSVPCGTTVRVKGAAANGSGKYRYAFYYKKTTSAYWQSLGEYYGNTQEVSFVPAVIADYYVKVNVKDSTDTMVSKIFTVSSTLPGEGDLVNLSSVSTTKTQKGQPVKITAKASGGSGDYTYAFYYKKSTSAAFIKLGEEYGTSDTAIFKPGVAAEYQVRINIRDSEGTTVSKQFNITSTAAAPLQNSSSVSTSAASVGSTVNIYGKASGGTAPYFYSYAYKKASGSYWTKLKAEAEVPTLAVFYPAVVADYQVRVTVQDALGAKEEKILTVKATKATLVNTSEISADRVKKGETVYLTGSATGGEAPYTYAFYYKKESSSYWTRLGPEFTENIRATFVPGGVNTYQVKIVVKDSKGATATRIYKVISE